MRTSLQGLLQRTGTLPSLPAVYNELVGAVQHSDSSVGQISDIIGRDPSLALRVLRLANGAFYGGSPEVLTLEDAVQRVGLYQIQDLVLATSVIRAFENLPAHLVDVGSFWKHSVACGLACTLLAEHRNDIAPERYFVGGLLHDVGRLIMFLAAPAESQEVLQRCEKEDQLATKMEMEVFGFDHAMVGAELISSWGLPRGLVKMVGGHHNPAATPVVFLDTFIVHYADFITTALEFGNSGERLVSPLVVPINCQPYLLDGDKLELLVKELDAKCDDVLPSLMA